MSIKIILYGLYLELIKNNIKDIESNAFKYTKSSFNQYLLQLISMREITINVLILQRTCCLRNVGFNL